MSVITATAEKPDHTSDAVIYDNIQNFAANMGMLTSHTQKTIKQSLAGFHNRLNENLRVNNFMPLLKNSIMHFVLLVLPLLFHISLANYQSLYEFGVFARAAKTCGRGWPSSRDGTRTDKNR